MRRKNAGVIIAGLDIRMRPAMIAAEAVYVALGRKEAVITAGLDGDHSAGSLHPYGLAIDLRTGHEINFTLDEKQKAVDLLREKLGIAFQVILHTTHIHVEYDA